MEDRSVSSESSNIIDVSECISKYFGSIFYEHLQLLLERVDFGANKITIEGNPTPKSRAQIRYS